MDTVVTFLLGLGLRIGIPIGITVLVFVLLRQLDKRWQKDAMSVPVVATGGKPCWELKGCSEDNKKKCPAAAQPAIPCWQIFRSRDGVLGENCIGCDVFRQAPVPVRV